MREFLHYVNGSAKTHLTQEWHYSMRWSPELSKKQKVNCQQHSLISASGLRMQCEYLPHPPAAMFFTESPPTIILSYSSLSPNHSFNPIPPSLCVCVCVHVRSRVFMHCVHTRVCACMCACVLCAHMCVLCVCARICAYVACMCVCV